MEEFLTSAMIQDISQGRLQPRGTHECTNNPAAGPALETVSTGALSSSIQRVESSAACHAQAEGAGMGMSYGMAALTLC